MSQLNQLRTVNVRPGDLHVTRKNILLETTLGSCVSASLWCKRLCAGGLSHGVLPRGPSEIDSGDPDAFRYVDLAIRHLVRQFERIGAAREEIQVKLFGGADVLPVLSAREGRPTVGSLNCRTAVETIQDLGLRVAASDLGGTRGRRIQFWVATGEVRVYRLDAWKEVES